MVSGRRLRSYLTVYISSPTLPREQFSSEALNEMKFAISSSQLESIILGAMISLYTYWSWRTERIYFINSIVEKEKDPQGYYTLVGLFVVGSIFFSFGALGLISGQAAEGHVL